ncbi:transcriptional enhancer factor TEF-1-like isoform X1 [Rhincodon typus]|uniref:transcriptional enhancer factor TEF-1-like isoform X1 n=1 Tax=Rhincodon typus TaxID=259920 RepID=UPI00202F7E13|nr:transcriptional enhancer factor TEF-1-like isoform X1 [Rhincodon typus]
MMPLIPEIFPEPVTSPASKILHLQKISLERKLLTAPKSGWLEPFTSELPLHLVKEEEAKHVAEQSLFKNKGLWKPDQHPRFVTPQIPLICRNELIARYIKLRTGKTRTRKQVSSHIQVLARRKSREIHSKLKDQSAKDKALASMAAMSSAQIVSATAIQNKLGMSHMSRPFPVTSGTPEFFQFWSGAVTSGEASSSQDVKPFIQQPFAVQPSVNHAPLLGYDNTSVGLLPASCHAAWQGRCIGTTKIRLVEFSAFMEQQRDQDTYNKHLFVHIGQSSPSYNEALLESVDIRQIYDKFPEKKGGLKELFEKGTPNTFFLVKFWADLSIHIQDEAGMFYGVTSQYESAENMTITCSSKVCSFGKQVVEKVETEYARFENGRFLYRIRRSPMCEYLINFIHKLKQLPEKYMMNSVLENFTILQVVTNRDTQELLLCVAYVFEVSTSEHGAQHHIYKLVKD